MDVLDSVDFLLTILRCQLINHKNSHNIQTIHKKTEEIYSEYDSRDNPEKIKYFIKYAKEELKIK